MDHIDRVDVAIIGGGIAGLVAASYAARAGRSVGLFERAGKPGGRAQTTVVDGFRLNLGAHALYVGGANAAIPEMHRLTVEVQHWMTDQQFSDLFAIAQVTPGPNVIITTLIGYQVAGFAGALVATVANASAFKSGRHFAAWIGLVPRQNGSGGKMALGGISKKGEPSAAAARARRYRGRPLRPQQARTGWMGQRATGPATGARGHRSSG